MTIATPNIAFYVEGAAYPSAKLKALLPSIEAAGWTTAILGLFHVGRASIQGQTDGDILFNDTMIIQQGRYVGDSEWPAVMVGLDFLPNISRVAASVGGGYPVEDFATLRNIYEGNNHSFNGTNLETCFREFRKTFPFISVIDMDCEDEYDAPSFLAFCQMLIGMGFEITFCPYTNSAFWANALANIQATNPGKVLWWNLQCYGVTGNTPTVWATAIANQLPNFDTTGYIVCGDRSRFYSGEWQGDCVSAVSRLFQGFASNPACGGGFIWTLDQIRDYDEQNHLHPDPDGQCQGGNARAYVTVIADALKRT